MLFLSFCFLLHGNGSVIVPQFHLQNDSELLKELFTVNVGVMEFKRVGDIRSISPIDYKNIGTSIKDELDSIPAIGLGKGLAFVKTLRYIKEKSSSDSIEGLDFLEKQIFFSHGKIDNAIIAKFMTKMRKNDEFSLIARKWLENFENPYYRIRTGDTAFERIFDSNKNVCIKSKIAVKEKGTEAKTYGPIDILFYGTVEKVGSLYLITLSVYSYHEDRILEEVSFVTDSENITPTVKQEIRNIIPRLFKVSYASLTVDTEDDETRIYLDSAYIGKSRVVIPYLVPGSYVLTLRKENYYDKKMNVRVFNSENKEVTLQLDRKKDLQTVHFYIEPLGTKIFINSVYQGKTPFKKALPRGTYIISAKNDLYQDYRYQFNIDKPVEEELAIVYHLQSRDLEKYFKIKQYLYYASFWNFTFSLAATIPSVTIAFMMYNGYGDYWDSADNNTPYTISYGLASAFTAYSVLSIGWLFFALANYLITYEKKDFIPIIDFYRNKDGEELLTVGGIVRFPPG